MTTPVFIPDVIGAVVTKVSAQLATKLGTSVFYHYGHYSEVVKNLDEKDKAPVVSDKIKYPLVWLVMDFEEKIKSTSAFIELDLQLIIATDTEANYKMDERKTNSFLPKLYPIYAELMNQFCRGRVFGMPSEVDHIKEDRPYWGIQSGSDNGKANLFNDFIDAVQLKNVKLNIRKDCISNDFSI